MKDPVDELIEAAQEVLRGSADHTRLHAAVAAAIEAVEAEEKPQTQGRLLREPNQMDDPEMYGYYEYPEAKRWQQPGERSTMSRPHGAPDQPKKNACPLNKVFFCIQRGGARASNCHPTGVSKEINQPPTRCRVSKLN